MGVWTIHVLLLPVKRISAEGKKPIPPRRPIVFRGTLARALLSRVLYTTLYKRIKMEKDINEI